MTLNKLNKDRAVVISMIGTKGGIGKTIAVANLAGAFADMGLRVLMIDTDKQQSLSKHYEIVEEANGGFQDFIIRSSWVGCISKTAIEGLDIIINNEEGNEVKNFIDANASNRIHQMYILIHKTELAKMYDVILIDTAGYQDLGGKQEMAIRASDIALTPVDPQWITSKEVVNTVALMRSLEPEHGIVIGNPIPPLYLFFNNVKRTRGNQEVMDMLSDPQGDVFQTMNAMGNGKLKMLKTRIPSLEVYNQAVLKQQPIHRLHTKRPSENTPSGLEVMKELTQELIPESAPLLFRRIEDKEELN